MTTPAAGKPAQSGLGPWVIPLLALLVFVSYVDRGNLATAAPLIKDELALTATQIGLLTSAFYWTYVPAQLGAGWIIERLNPYRTLVFSLIIWSLATLLTGFASGFLVMFALRLMLGVGEATALPGASQLIGRHVPSNRLGGANAWLVQGVSLGPAFGVFFGGLLMAQFGWREVFIMFGVVSLAWLAPWFAATRRLSVEADSTPEARDSPSLREMLGRREMWGAALGHLAGNYGFYFVISWLPLYLVKARGYSLPEMATVSGLIYLTYALAAIVSGWLIDRWIIRGATPNLARKTVAGVAYIAAAGGLLVAGLGTGAASLAGLFVAGAAMGAFGPHLFAVAQTLAGPRGSGKWVGLQNGIANMAGIVGPIVTGMIVDATGSYTGAFLTAAAITALGVVGWVVVIPKVAPIDWEADRRRRAAAPG